MTEGTIMDKLIAFALPLALSSILQLMFNAVDIIVVGRFTGKEALAAVGATTALISLFSNFFIGVSLGANVMTARYYASGAKKRLSDTVHTSLTVALIGGVLMVFIGWFGAGPALRIMGTPESVIGQSELYMRIYFLGMPFFMLYNYGAAILRAVGDTKRPLLFLIISGVANALLNMYLVIVFKLGVAGVASATVFSQMISCVLVITTLMKTEGAYRFEPSKLGITPVCLKQIMIIGMPAGIQSMVISLSNSLLQSSVNSFGDIAMAGYTAANNIFGFLYVSVNAVSQACMSFTSQNYGAGKPKRMDKVLIDCVILEIAFPLVLGSAVYFFGSDILGIYNTDPRVIAYGLEVLAYTTVPYFICGLMDLFPGALRGMGHSGIPMVLSVLGTVGMRVFWIYCIFPMHRSLTFLFLSYPLSWTVTLLMQIVCYYFVRKKVHRELLKKNGNK